MNNSLINTRANEIINSNVYMQAIATGIKVKNLSVFEKQSLLSDCIAAAIFIGGWAPKQDMDVALMIQSLMPDLSKRLSGMTDLEVKAAFDSGAKGYYGETFGISVASAIKWLDAYYLDSKRMAAQKQLQQLIATPPRTPLTREEKRLFINDAFKKYCLHDTYIDYGNIVYDWLDHEGLITYTTAQKREFLEAGRKLIYDRLNNWKNLEEKRENDKKIADLMDNDNEPIAEGKRLALLDFFKYLKIAGAKKITFKEPE